MYFFQFVFPGTDLIPDTGNPPMSPQHRSICQLFALTALLAVGLDHAVQAQVVFEGALTSGSPAFSLASANQDAVLNPLALYNGAHPYDVYSFQLDTADTITIAMTGKIVGANGALIDPAVLVYQGFIAPGTYDPAAAPTYVGGNDDIVQGVNRNSNVSLSLAANTTYTVILTTWETDLGIIDYPQDSTQFGGYEATLQTTSALISPIPEPTTYGLLMGGATLGLVGWRRWRRISAV